MATTGHKSLLVHPKCSTNPDPNGSVFEHLSRTCMCVGEECESTDTSHTCSILVVNADCDGQVNSPALRNPKKPRQKAAQSMKWSDERVSCDHASRILLSRAGVMGSLFGRGVIIPTRRKPFSAYSRRGKCKVEGSGSPLIMCKCRIAQRYDLTDP